MPTANEKIDVTKENVTSLFKKIKNSSHGESMILRPVNENKEEISHYIWRTKYCFNNENIEEYFRRQITGLKLTEKHYYALWLIVNKYASMLVYSYDVFLDEDEASESIYSKPLEFLEELRGNEDFRKKHVDDKEKKVSNEVKEMLDLILYKLFSDQYFLPGGRITYSLGTPREKTTLSNCFVMPDVEDTMEGILNCLKDSAITMKAGGGVGYYFGKLRPSGSKTMSSYGYASGPLSFMEIFNTMCETIKSAGGRRGAQIAILPIWHPDIEYFIEAKRGLENNAFKNFNFSIAITDEFMSAIENDLNWELKFPNYEEYPSLYKMLWNDENCKGLKHWENFLETLLKASNDNALSELKTPYENYYKAYLSDTNDGKDLPPLTYKVYKTVRARDLWEQIMKHAYEWSEPGVLFIDTINEFSPMSYIETINVTNPCVTGDTLIQTIEGNIPIKDLVGKKIDVYCMDNNGDLAISKAYKIRKTQEDASLVKITTSRGNLICTPEHPIYTKNRGYIPAKDLKLDDKIVGLNRKMMGEKHSAVCLTGSKYIKEHRFIMSNYFNIDGLDVHHKDNNSLNNKFSNLEILEHEKHSVISNEGHIDWMEHDEKGMYIKKDYKQKKKQLNLKENPKSINLYLKSIKLLKRTEDVYNMEVKDYHNFIANGIVVHNCGEQPLPAYGSCNLSHINLSKIVKHPFLDGDGNQNNDPSINITRDNISTELLKFLTRIGTFFLDRILDVNWYPLENQKKYVEENRVIGLGVTAVGDLLAMLKLRYGSQQSTILLKELTELTYRESFLESLQLAKILGKFPKFDYEKFTNTTFFKKVFNPIFKADINFENEISFNELLQDLREYGVRNGRLLTIAPVGTGSMLCNNLSSGIEPIFELKGLDRRILTDPIKKTEIIITMNDFAYDLYEGMVEKGLVVRVPEEDLNYFFATSTELSIEDHLNVQIAMQSAIDGSISKTINIPTNCEFDYFKSVYLTAYKGKLKGTTIFRENEKMKGILSSSKKEEKKPKNTLTLPDECPAIRYKTKGENGEKIFMNITYEEESFNPLEVFVTIPKKSGEIDGKFFPKVYFEKKSLWDLICRLISLMLRSGIKLDLIINQIEKASYSITDYPTLLAKVLTSFEERFSSNKKIESQSTNTEIDERLICQKCGKGKLIIRDGCKVCNNCNYSPCD
jgi:ribonucleotide reductase alpha subunit